MTEDVFDLERAKKATRGRLDFLKRLLDQYLGNLPKEVDALRAASQGDDLESFASAAHRLKGSSGAIAAVELQSVFEDVEHAARHGDKPGALQHMERVDPAVERFRTHIEQVEFA